MSKILPELGTLFADKGNERIHIDGTEILPVPLPRRNLTGGHLPITDHQHVGCFLHLRLTDLVAQFFITEITFHTNTRREELSPDLLPEGNMFLGHSH